MIAKLIGKLVELRRTLTDPSTQVAVAGLALGFGVKVLAHTVEQLVDTVATHESLRKMQLAAEHSLLGRMYAVEGMLAPLYAGEDGIVRVRRPDDVDQAAEADPGDEPDDLTQVELFPLGRAAQITAG